MNLLAYASIIWLLASCKTVPTGSVVAGASSKQGSAATSIFDEDSVLEIELQMDDWEAMKNQEPRGGRCNWEYRQGGSRYDWFKAASITINKQTLYNVGAKKKSWCGSESKVKPSFTLKFDKFDKANKDLAKSIFGSNELILNNSVQDPSLLRQCFAYRMFRRALLAAPSCNFAHVRVNGKDYGIYVHVESISKSFIERNYGTPLGNLYEMGATDFADWALPGFIRDREGFSDDTSGSDIGAMIAAVKQADTGADEAMLSSLDLEEYLSFWAMEIILAHWDGITSANNNGYIYFAQDKKLRLIPWGADQTLSATDARSKTAFIRNEVAKNLYKRDVYKTALHAKIWEILDKSWREDALLREISDTSATIQAYMSEEQRSDMTKAVVSFSEIVRERKNQVAAFIPRPTSLQRQN